MGTVNITNPAAVNIITLDISGIDRFEYVIVKQGDVDTHYLIVKLINNGNTFLINENNLNARLFFTKPDGKEAFIDCEIKDNNVIICFTEEMLVVSGLAKAEFIISNKLTGQILKTATIDVIIIPSAFQNSNITSSNEYNALIQKIDEVEKYKSELGEFITATDDINIDDLPSSGGSESNNGIVYAEEKISGINVTLQLKDKTYFNLTDEVSNITIEDPANIDVNFNCCLFFKTGLLGNNISTKVIQKVNIKFIGNDCTSGMLYYKPKKTYLIEFKYAGGILFADVTNYVEVEGDNDNKDDNNDNNQLLDDFSGADELIEVAMSYQRVRDDYLTYGQTNIMTSNGSKSWEEVTTLWNGVYLRHLDCSAAVGLWLRGIHFEEVFASKAVYNAKDLSARTDTYPWAFEVRRTAAQIYEDLLALGYILPQEQIHSETEQWAGLKKGDVIFQGGKDNGRTLGIYHVMIYYGLNSQNKPCVIEVTSSSTRYHKYSDGTNSKYNVGCQVIQFAKKNLNDIVAVARIQK